MRARASVRTLRPGKHDKIRCTMRPGGEVMLTPADADGGDDRVLGQFLDFLARDIVDHPEHRQSVDTALVQRFRALTGTVEVGLDEMLSSDGE